MKNTVSSARTEASFVEKHEEKWERKSKNEWEQTKVKDDELTLIKVGDELWREIEVENRKLRN